MIALAAFVMPRPARYRVLKYLVGFQVRELLHRAQHCHRAFDQVDIPYFARLQPLHASLERPGTLHAHCPVVPIDVAPLQCDDFLGAHAGHKTKLEIARDTQVVMFRHVGEDHFHLINGQRIGRCLLRLRVGDAGKGVIQVLDFPAGQREHTAQWNQVIVAKLWRRPRMRSDDARDLAVRKRVDCSIGTQLALPEVQRVFVLR